MAQRWKCKECDKEFGVGDWTCADGVSNHVVAEKTYRSLDAPTDPSTRDDSLKDGRTVVCNIPPAQKVMEGDEVRMIGEGSVEFIRGRYTTSDPIQQYWLDKKPSYNATEDQWRGAWYSTSQKLVIKEMELNAMSARLQNEQNELLARTQKQKQEVSVTR